VCVALTDSVNTKRHLLANENMHYNDCTVLGKMRKKVKKMNQNAAIIKTKEYDSRFFKTCAA